jgi:hypothetical protein
MLFWHDLMLSLINNIFNAKYVRVFNLYL